MGVWQGGKIETTEMKYEELGGRGMRKKEWKSDEKEDRENLSERESVEEGRVSR